MVRCIFGLPGLTLRPAAASSAVPLHSELRTRTFAEKERRMEARSREEQDHFHLPQELLLSTAACAYTESRGREEKTTGGYCASHTRNSHPYTHTPTHTHTTHKHTHALFLILYSFYLKNSPPLKPNITYAGTCTYPCR